MKRIPLVWLVVVLCLGSVGRVRAQEEAARLTIPPVFGKPLAEVEAILGDVRHVGKSLDRYYKTDGFLRVVVYMTPDNLMRSITFQFPRKRVSDWAQAMRIVGVLKVEEVAQQATDRRNAIALGNIPDAPEGWSALWITPGESGNDELTFTGPTATTADPTTGVKPTRRMLSRLRRYKITGDKVDDLLQNGQRFYDPKYRTYIRWKDGVYVTFSAKGEYRSTVKGDILSRWQPL